MHRWLPLLLMFITLIAIGLITARAHLERALGEIGGLVYLHGAWVWAAMVFFLLAGITGLAGLVSRR